MLVGASAFNPFRGLRNPFGVVIEQIQTTTFAVESVDNIMFSFGIYPGSATINFDPANDFWTDIGQRGGQLFINALDYVALDFFPDVFRPLPPHLILREAVHGVLQQFRQVSMPQAGIPATVPIHIGENGWPTSPTRSYTRQAGAIETIIQAVHEYREVVNIHRYELFNLRDADSSQNDIFYQFGLLRDDYSPKPAFAVFKKLVAELSL